MAIKNDCHSALWAISFTVLNHVLPNSGTLGILLTLTEGSKDIILVLINQRADAAPGGLFLFASSLLNLKPWRLNAISRKPETKITSELSSLNTFFEVYPDAVGAG